MKAIVGTAGHIDHGKSALINALTGIETDRLPEERERGISIELGFAYLELPDGERAGIVDVPGHERFIRQMLAGAQGFDLVLLVVAADDGVMPQTEEHFEICHLLGVKNGIFVITKTDLASAERVEEVRGEIEILAAGTEFERAPVVAVSAISGSGVEELRATIVAALIGLEREEVRGAFRMPIDRAFVLKGYGLIVTGTAAAGSVVAGDELEVAPRGSSIRVRSVQVHGQDVQRASAGQRVALNLVGVELGDISRGDSIVAPLVARRGLRVRCARRGVSRATTMSPLLQPGDVLEIGRGCQDLRVGDVLACRLGEQVIVHRLLGYDESQRLITAGDRRPCRDEPLPMEAVFGRVSAVRTATGRFSLESRRARALGWLLASCFPLAGRRRAVALLAVMAAWILRR